MGPGLRGYMCRFALRGRRGILPACYKQNLVKLWTLRAFFGLLPHMPELSGQVAREYVVGRAQDLLNAATELNKAILQSELTEK